MHKIVSFGKVILAGAGCGDPFIHPAGETLVQAVEDRLNVQIPASLKRDKIFAKALFGRTVVDYCEAGRDVRAAHQRFDAPFQYREVIPA